MSKVSRVNLEEEKTVIIKKVREIKAPLKPHYYDRPDIIEIGIDEVGRGPLFGRVYTACVILPKSDFKFELIKDSKKFTSKKKLAEVAEYIMKNSIAFSIAYIDEKTIDAINIKQSTFKAMHNAIKNIIDENNLVKADCGLLIDGNDFKPYTYINDDDMIESIQSTLIVGGDALYSSIAAASIVAKYAHDTYILDLCRQYPKLDEYYNLSKNMGYGTKAHIDGILEYGITQWHRKTFGQVCKNAVANTEFL